jgi:signal transduction histidine kinase
MRNPDLAPLIDWIIVSLRWLTLLSVTISLAFRSPLSLAMIGTLLIAALWNFLLTALAVLNQRFNAHHLLSVLSDMAIAYGLFFASGLLGGGLAWAGILPLISATIYFQLRGALLVTATNLTIQGLMALSSSSPAAVGIFIGTMLPLYLGLSFVFLFLKGRMDNILESTHKKDKNKRQRAEQPEDEHRRVIYKLISALSATLNYQRVLETALDLSGTVLSDSNNSADGLISTVLLFSENDSNKTALVVGSARGFSNTDMRITLPGTEGLIGHTIDEGVPQLTREIIKDPELGQIFALRSCKEAYCIPLRTGLDTCGVLLFAYPQNDFFTPERREILDIIGNQATIAIENARLYQDLEQEKERMMEIQEEARKKMARDLHDGPTQSISAIAMRINFARRLIERDPKATAQELYKIEELARRTTKEIRHMLFTLRPLVLESQGLIAALESMAAKMRETYSQNVIIQADPDLVSRLEMAKQAVIFYIVEEAVNNARKHAQATHIWVRLNILRADLALLEIEDDGVGFNLNEVDSSYEGRGSLGMVNMRERAELVNGMLHIKSSIGHGTQIQLAIPLTEEAYERIRRRV